MKEFLRQYKKKFNEKLTDAIVIALAVPLVACLFIEEKINGPEKVFYPPRSPTIRPNFELAKRLDQISFLEQGPCLCWYYTKTEDCWPADDFISVGGKKYDGKMQHRLYYHIGGDTVSFDEWLDYLDEEDIDETLFNIDIWNI
jgi:hypothetical protein